MKPKAPSIPAELVKPDALRLLASSTDDPVNPYIGEQAGPFLQRYFDSHAPSHNAAITVADGLGGGVETTVHEGLWQDRDTPHILNSAPAHYPEERGSRKFWVGEVNVLSLRDGYVLALQETLGVLNGERRLVRPYSSVYSQLLHAYEFPAETALSEARRIDGRVLLIGDDIGPANYCHWTADWLARIALAEPGEDLYVATLPLTTRWQRDSLRMMGFAEDRIVELNPWTAIQARELIVPGNVSHIRHPAFQAAPWALERIRAGYLTRGVKPGGRRIHISRRDASSRRITNDEAFSTYLETLGFETFAMSDLSVVQQADLFASASHVVGLHGASLTNIIFAPSSTRFLEILPQSYQTPAFWILASARGIDYAIYTANKVIDGAWTQLDDIEIDIEDFDKCCSAFLA